MTLHQQRVHPQYIEGCFGCKVGGIGFGSVPGGTRAGSIRKWHERKLEKNLTKYKGARDNGLRPEGTTVEAVERAERDAESLQRGAEKLGFKNVEGFDKAVAANG